MKNKSRSLIIVNIVLLILEIVAFIHDCLSFGPDLFVWYTVDSNVLQLLISGLVLYYCFKDRSIPDFIELLSIFDQLIEYHVVPGIRRDQGDVGLPAVDGERVALVVKELHEALVAQLVPGDRLGIAVGDVETEICPGQAVVDEITFVVELVEIAV